MKAFKCQLEDNTYVTTGNTRGPNFQASTRLFHGKPVRNLCRTVFMRITRKTLVHSDRARHDCNHLDNWSATYHEYHVAPTLERTRFQKELHIVATSLNFCTQKKASGARCHVAQARACDRRGQPARNVTQRLERVTQLFRATLRDHQTGLTRSSIQATFMPSIGRSTMCCRDSGKGMV